MSIGHKLFHFIRSHTDTEYALIPQVIKTLSMQWSIKSYWYWEYRSPSSYIDKIVQVGSISPESNQSGTALKYNLVFKIQQDYAGVSVFDIR